MGYKKALLVIGAQNDFCNTYIRQFARKGLPVFFWRVGFPSKLKMCRRKIILSGSMGSGKDSCSAFKAEDAAGLDLLSMLKIFGVKELYVGGLATDCGVKLSVRDALKNGLKVKFLRGGINGADKPGDSVRSIKAMLAKGVILI